MYTGQQQSSDSKWHDTRTPETPAPRLNPQNSATICGLQKKYQKKKLISYIHGNFQNPNKCVKQLFTNVCFTS